MSLFTAILNLIKPTPTDTTNTFNLDTFLNNNWDKIDTFAAKTITTDKVINNLTTTEVGFALDGRQGKVIGDSLNTMNGTLSSHTSQLSDMDYQTAGGTATAITLTMLTLRNGYAKNFIAKLDNGGVATTINTVPVYKPGTTQAPTIKANKPYTMIYNEASTCFFLKASATGTALASQVLKDVPYSNEVDTDLVGTMPNNGALGTVLAINGSYAIPAGYTTGGTVTQNITTKAAATYNPSTVAQTIAAAQYLSGIQTIAAITGTATDADVVAGKTYNSAAGILRTGAATIASLGGTQYATGTVNHTVGTGNTISLPFTPRAILLTHSASGYVGYYFIATDKDTINFYQVGSSGTQVYLTRTANSIVLNASLPTGTTTYYLYA